MRVYVVLCVQDADKMKLTFCIDTVTNVHMSVCRLQFFSFFLFFFFLRFFSFFLVLIMGRHH